MKGSICSFILCCTLLAATFGAVQESSAQTYNWQQIWKFDTGAVSIKFLTIPTQEQMGFAGLWNGDVWKTTNGGSTWEVTFNSHNLAPVSSFAFKDELLGWFSAGWHIGFSTGGCYRTTNGGVSWLPIMSGIDLLQVYYHAPTAHLYAIGDSSLFESTNDGDSWTKLFTGTFNSISFSDADHGVVSTFNDEPYLYTTDGGQSWQQSPMKVHIWSPLPIPNTTTFFAASEAELRIYKSDNGGATWQDIASAVNSAPTGDMQGDDCQLFYQCTGSGLVASYNQGKSWYYIGGPKNNYDTRFAVTDRYIYVSNDEGELYKAERLKTVVLSPSAVNLNKISRCAEIDTAIYVYNTVCDSISLLAITSDDPDHCEIIPQKLPLIVQSGEVLRIPIKIRPSDTGSVNTVVKLEYGKEYELFKVDVPVEFTGVNDSKPNVGLSTDLVSFPTLETCNDTVKEVIFTNPLCSDITIDSIYWDSTSSDINVENLPQLPLTLTASSIDTLRFRFTPIRSRQSFATLKLRVRLDSVMLDTTIRIVGASFTTELFTVSESAIDYDTVICGREIKSITIKNATCDSLFIDYLYKDNRAFKILSLPDTLLANDSSYLVVEFSSDSNAKYLDSLTIFAHSPELNQFGKVLLRATSVFPPKSLAVPAHLDLGTLSYCEHADTIVTLVNHSPCDTMHLMHTSITGDGWASTIDTLPLALAPSDSIKIRIHVEPSGANTSTAVTAHDTLHLSFNGLDTSVALVARGVSPKEALKFLTDSSFTARLCERSTDTLQFSNPTCKPIIIDSLLLTALTDDLARFGLGTLSLPITLQPSEILRIPLSYNGILDAVPSIRNATLHLFARDPKYSYTTGLRCESIETRTPVSIETEGKDHSKRITVATGEPVYVWLRPSAFIDSSLGLKNIDLSLQYDQDILTLDTIAASDWKITILDTIPILRVHLERDSISAISPDSLLAFLRFKTALSVNNYTPIAILGLSFKCENEDAQCLIVSKPRLDTTQVYLTPICADETIQRFMRGEPAWEFLSIAPNPVGKGTTKLSIHLTAIKEGAARLRLTSALGQELILKNTLLTKGDNNLQVDVSKLPSGDYFFTLENDDQIETKRISIIK